MDKPSVDFNVLLRDMHNLDLRHSHAVRYGERHKAALLKADWEQLDAELQYRLENLGGPAS